MTSAPQENTTDDDATADEGDDLLLAAGDDVRVGPDQSDEPEPEAGAAEPTD